MVVKKCIKCNRIDRIYAKGLCMSCYNGNLRRKIKVRNKKKYKVI